MTIDNKYNIGQTVYFRTDKYQNPALVTGIRIDPNGFFYELSQHGLISQAFEIELSAEKDVLAVCGIEKEQPK